MQKHITTIAIGLIQVLVVAFVVLYADYRENAIVGTLKDFVRAQSGEVRQQIKTEQKHRCQLAAVLFKSGLDLPTDCLVAFSSGQCEDPSREMLLEAVSQQAEPLERADDYAAFLEKMKSGGGEYPVIAPLDANTYLLASLNAKPSRPPDIARQYAAEIRLKVSDTQDGWSQLKATCFSSTMEFLSQPGLTTGGLRKIYVKSIVQPMDSNEPRERTR
jgi:hypothetical protein